MADFSSLPWRYRAQMALYRWQTAEPAWTPFRAPLSRARVALVTSAGLYRPGADPPFRRLPGGDTSFRVLPDDVSLRRLILGQTSRAFDRAPVSADPNVALPLDRLHALVAAGVVGESAPRHLSFDGSITAPGRLVRESAPDAARTLQDDGVDAVLLVPI